MSVNTAVLEAYPSTFAAGVVAEEAYNARLAALDFTPSMSAADFYTSRHAAVAPAAELTTDVSQWPRKIGFSALALSSALLLSSCRTDGGSPGGNQGGAPERVNIFAGTTYYNFPGRQPCATSNAKALGVPVKARQEGWVGVPTSASEKGLPGMRSSCRSNTDATAMWVAVSRTEVSELSK